MEKNEYKCEICNGIWIKDLTDEQCEEQFKKEFPNMERQENDGLVCDDCFKEMFK